MTTTDFFDHPRLYNDEAHRQGRVSCMGIVCGACGATEHAVPAAHSVTVCWRCASLKTSSEIHFHLVS